MQVLYPCCCGLDIHKKFVVACVLTTADDGRVQKATRTFSTMTDDLLALLDWLTGAGCTHVAMESTSSYWRPVYNVLEGQLVLLVAAWVDPDADDETACRVAARDATRRAIDDALAGVPAAQVERLAGLREDARNQFYGGS